MSIVEKIDLFLDSVSQGKSRGSRGTDSDKEDQMFRSWRRQIAQWKTELAKEQNPNKKKKLQQQIKAKEWDLTNYYN
jgi:hypothetical protein